jgi:hypothetical protein
MRAKKPKKTKTAKAPAERKPRLGDWITRPDGSVAKYVREEDDEQRAADHFRTVDTLGLMLKNGTITGAMFDAGQQFSLQFALAFASGVASPRMDGMPGGTPTGELMVERHAGAARSVREALNAVGGMGSPAGSALWFVAGLGLSIRDWALRDGWNGKRMSREEGKGILLAALGMLARYYGFERGQPHRKAPAPHEFDRQS